MTIRRLAPATLGILVLLVACTDLIGPRGDSSSVRLVVQPSFGQVPAAAAADNPASRVDNVHLVLRNAGGSVVLDTVVEWPLGQDTLRMEMDVVVQEQQAFELTIEGRSGDRVLFQAGPVSLELSEDDTGGTVEASPVLEYAGPGAEVAAVEITGAPGTFTAGSAVELGAVGTNDDGSDAGDLIIIWTSLDPDAATVNEDGRVQVGHDASRAVSIEGRVAFTTISDTARGPILPAAMTVDPETSTLTALGAELTLTASPVGEDGGDVTGVSIEWSVVDPSVLELASEGDDDGSTVATALTPGATRVVATAGALSDSADVTVDQTVARLDVEPDSVTLEQIEATAEATAAAFDANDNAVEDAEVAWSSGAEDVATVGEDGTITAVSPGTAWIMATSDEASDSLLATVANAAPELAITGPADGAAFGEGETITFEGTAEDLEDGDLSASIEWSSDLDGELGTGASLAVDDLSVGSHTITASVSDSGELADSATIGVEVALPNLVLADLGVDATEPLGSDDTVRITAEIVNDGAVESGAADLAIRALDGATEAVVAELIVDGPALAAGETAILEVDLSEADLEAGQQRELEGDSIIFEVEIDPDDAIDETDETDNAQRSRPFEVAVEVDLPPGVTSGWIGTSGDWHDPSNWFPADVPTAEDVVVILASADAQPVLTADATVGGLTIEEGATLDVNGHTLTVTGDLNAGSTIVDGTDAAHPAVVMTGPGALQGTVPHLLITGPVGAVGTVQVMNDLEVAGEGAEFYVGPQLVRVGDDLLVGDGGTIQMHEAEGVLDVADNVEIASHGGATSVGGAGLLVVGSDFRATVVTGDGPAFVGTGTHRTIMAGTGPGATDGAIEIELGEGGGFNHLELVGAFDVAFVGGVATVGGDLAVAIDGALAADDLFVLGGLTAATESAVHVGSLVLVGAMEVAAGEDFLVDVLFLAGDGQVIQPGLPYQTISVSGRAALGGTTTIASSLHVIGEAAELTVGPHQVTVGEHFATAAGGMLRMEDADGVLDVNGFGVTFGGGESVLTAGTIRVAGDFVQLSDDAGNGDRAFRAGQGLLTIFDGSGTQTIEMHDPGPPDGDFSFFGTVEVAHTGDGLFLAGDVHAAGPLVVPAGPAPSIFSEGFTLTVAGLDVDGLTLDKTPLVVDAGADAPMRFDDVAFQAYDDPPGMTQLTLVHPGAADPFAFDGLAFDMAPGPDGTSNFLVDATDSEPADDRAFTVVLSNTDPADGSELTRELDGAVVEWADAVSLPEGATIGWVGASSPDWGDPANWSTATTPAPEDVVFIDASAPQQPALSGAVTVGGLIVEPGASLDLAGFDLTVTGDLDAGTTITNSGSVGRVVMSGVESTLKGTLPELHIDGVIFTAGAAHVTGNLSVGGTSGSLGVGAHQVVVDGHMDVMDAGRLFMDHVDAVVDVAQNVSFHSTQTSTPSAGELRVGGDFYAGVAATDPSFSAMGTHRTLLHGPGPQTITVDDGGFHDLQISSGGTVTSSSVFVGGQLNITEPVSFSGTGESTVRVEGDVITALSSGLTLFSLLVGGDLLVSGGFDVFSTTFTGTDQSIPALPYEHVNVHGTAFLGADMRISGNLFVGQAFASSPAALDISDATLEVVGDLHVQPASGSGDPAANSGVLVMQHAGSILDIQGHALFEGGESVLTLGTIRIGGDFSQDSDLSGVTNNFAAQPDLRVVLDGTGFQSVDFTDPVASHFGTLEVANTGEGVHLGQDVHATGALVVPNGPGPLVFSAGSTLTVAGLDVDGLTLDATPLVVEAVADAPLRFDNVTFQSFPPSVAQLTVRHPGAADPFVFDGLTFDQSPDPPLFIRAEDTADDGIGLVIELTNPFPLDGSGSTTDQVGGATVEWVP